MYHGTCWQLVNKKSKNIWYYKDILCIMQKKLSLLLDSFFSLVEDKLLLSIGREITMANIYTNIHMYSSFSSTSFLSQLWTTRSNIETEYYEINLNCNLHVLRIWSATVHKFLWNPMCSRKCKMGKGE